MYTSAAMTLAPGDILTTPKIFLISSWTVDAPGRVGRSAMEDFIRHEYRTSCLQRDLCCRLSEVNKNGIPKIYCILKKSCLLELKIPYPVLTLFRKCVCLFLAGAYKSTSSFALRVPPICLPIPPKSDSQNSRRVASPTGCNTRRHKNSSL